MRGGFVDTSGFCQTVFRFIFTFFWRLCGFFAPKKGERLVLGEVDSLATDARTAARI
jgi:hypothetical protein